MYKEEHGTNNIQNQDYNQAPAIGVQGQRGVLLHGVGVVHHHGEHHHHHHQPQQPHHMGRILSRVVGCRGAREPCTGHLLLLLLGVLCQSWRKLKTGRWLVVQKVENSCNPYPSQCGPRPNNRGKVKTAPVALTQLVPETAASASVRPKK